MYSASPGVPPWQANGHHSQNAYVPVNARQTFSGVSMPAPPPSYIPPPFIPQPPAPAPSQDASTQAKKTQWSPSVRDYVSRSFALENAIKDVSRQEVEVKLKQIITEMASTGQLDTILWDHYPLPQQLILEERNRAALAPLNVSPFPQSNKIRPMPLDTTSKKRKSSEFENGDQHHTNPPWRGNNPAGGLADRISYAPTDKRQKMQDPKAMSKSNLEARRKRFENGQSGLSSPTTPRTPRGQSPEPAKQGPVVGRNQKLEKNYFRLTAPPKPEDVRPLEILRQTLDLLKKKWRNDGNYVYICDQFKSLRQDLTVQHIKNEFTTTVYEIHARIALEKGDLGEYNQCQTQLRSLYKMKLGGHPVEFKAYRILYYIHTCNRTDMINVLSELTPADKKEEAIKHALDVRSALALGNYHKFFQLYLKVPNMGAYLMDMFVERERLAALARMCKA
jgi:SAC3 family protein LENG8/THP3